MSDGKTGPTEAGVIAELARKALGEAAVIAGPAGRHFLVTPDGYEATEIQRQDFEELPAPFLTDQKVTVQTTDSLVEYVNIFKKAETVLFADISSDVILAVIDYHAPDLTHRLKHRAQMQLPRSIEWATWSAIDGKMMEQGEFARFLQENGADISAPDGATVLEACKDLHAVRNVNFRKAVRTASDNEDFEYVEETEAKSKKGSIELPTKFELTIPVYFDGRTTQLYAFLRWRLDEGSLKLGIKLHRAEHVRQAMFKEIVGQVADRTELPAVYGKPSGSF